MIRAFLAREGWGGAQVAPLAGDASNRRYLRLRGGPAGGGAVLMDAPPARGEDVRPFVSMAAFLGEHGFSAPQILAQDAEAGLLLIEDLGDDLFARHLQARPQDEMVLYSAAVDVLGGLHQIAPPALAAYDTAAMAPLSGLAAEWYAQDVTRAPEIAEAMATALRGLPDFRPVVALRDYHSENLLWLPGVAGWPAWGCWIFRTRCWGIRPMTWCR